MGTRGTLARLSVLLVTIAFGLEASATTWLEYKDKQGATFQVARNSVSKYFSSLIIDIRLRPFSGSKFMEARLLYYCRGDTFYQVATGFVNSMDAPLLQMSDDDSAGTNVFLGVDARSDWGFIKADQLDSDLRKWCTTLLNSSEDLEVLVATYDTSGNRDKDIQGIFVKLLSVKDVDGTRGYWTATRRMKGHKGPVKKNTVHTLEKWSAKCEKDSQALLASYEYAANKRLTKSVTADERGGPRFNAVVPESVGEAVFRFVCAF